MTDDQAAGLSRRDLIGRTAAIGSVSVPALKLISSLSIRGEVELEQALPSLSNWGRWGPDDQLGTLNFMSDATRLVAAASVRTGRVVALGREFSSTMAELRDFSYRMVRYQDALPEEAGCYDVIDMTAHGFAVTHVDALCHVFTPGGGQGMYNGYPIDDVTPAGALQLGIEQVAVAGLVGRGILLDIAAVRGGPLPLGSAIMPEDLDAAERLHDVQVGEGDTLFVCNGAARIIPIASARDSTLPACHGFGSVVSPCWEEIRTTTSIRPCLGSSAGPSPCTWSSFPIWA